MTPADYELLSKGISRDMSSGAIADRLRIAADLREFARVLGGARCIGRVQDPAVTGKHGAGVEPKDDGPRG